MPTGTARPSKLEKRGDHNAKSLAKVCKRFGKRLSAVMSTASTRKSVLASGIFNPWQRRIRTGHGCQPKRLPRLSFSGHPCRFAARTPVALPFQKGFRTRRPQGRQQHQYVQGIAHPTKQAHRAEEGVREVWGITKERACVCAWAGKLGRARQTWGGGLWGWNGGDACAPASRESSQAQREKGNPVQLWRNNGLGTKA
jgi:hypothetical protein